MLTFLPYEEKHQSILKRLTLEWLEKYVSIEPEDVEFMEHPKEYALDKGGFIYLVQYNNEIVATVSLFKVSDKKFELGKLALTERYKGLKLGTQIMEFAIDKAYKHKIEELILYTSKRLIAAHNLYLKFGFVEIPQENQKYIEAEVKMFLDLRNH